MKKYFLYRFMMDKRLITITMLGMLILSGLLTVSANGSAGAVSVGGKINTIFCKIANLLFLISGGLASLVIILAGVRWVTAAEDPGARNAAKTTIISAFVGLVIILLAVFIVSYVMAGMLPDTTVDPVQWISGNCGNLQDTTPPTS